MAKSMAKEQQTGVALEQQLDAYSQAQGREGSNEVWYMGS